ncbi:MAG: VOC family protein [Phaeodactylibacter sp.]|nr:VOC family protein [Phaeodactylibacter sp.]
MKKAVFFLSFLLPGLLPGQVAITGFNHLALSVSDIEASTAFYRDILGLEPIEVPDDLKAIRSWFKFGGGQDLHLLAGRTEPVADNSRTSSHYSLTIPDADAVEASRKRDSIITASSALTALGRSTSPTPTVTSSS